MLADIFGKSAIPWGVRCPRLLSSWCVGSGAVCSNRCPGHGAFLYVIFLYRGLLTLGVTASDGTRFGRWPEVSRCPDLLGPLKYSKENAPSTHAPPPWPEGAHSACASWKFYLLPRPLLKCMPNMGRVGSCKSKSWSRSTCSAWSRETLPDFRFCLQRSLTCPANCLRLLPAVLSKPLNLPGRCPGFCRPIILRVEPSAELCWPIVPGFCRAFRRELSITQARHLYSSGSPKISKCIL